MKQILMTMLLGVAFAGLPLVQGAHAQGTLPQDTAEGKAAQEADAAFDKAIVEFGQLAGASYACLAEDQDLKVHETRVFSAYTRLVQMFGTERAFKFSAAYGYGTAEANDEKKCAEIVDQFTDKWAVIAQKYDLVTGE